MNETAFHPEDKARSLIDRRLAACGWLIQSKADINLGAGLGIAVREFQTASGPVDYGLFVGRTLCGVIEAKAEGSTLSGFSEQASRYIAGMPRHLLHEEGAGSLRICRLRFGDEIRPEDLMHAPDFSGRGDIVRARAMFGVRLPALLDELTDTLVA